MDYGIRENSSAIDTYNAAINEIVLLTPGVLRGPLLFQLKTHWDEARDADKKKIIEKASEDCLLVCKEIPPESGDKLFESLERSKEETINQPARDDLVMLITAYKKCYIKELKETNSQPICFSILSKSPTGNPFTLWKTSKLANKAGPLTRKDP